MKKNLTTLVAIGIATFMNAQTPHVEWVKAIGGIGNERTNSVETDLNGNIILAGRFQSPTILIDGITLKKNTEDNADVADIFIIKLDKTGKAIWAVTAGGKGDDHATSCVTDKDGNIYVVGWFESKTLKFRNIILTNKTVKGSDMYVAKFSPDGICLWANNAGGEGGNGDYSTVSLDQQNNVVVAGIAGKVMDFGNGVKFTNEKSGIYVAKYSTDGKLLWAKSPVGSGEAQGVGTDAKGNVFIGGFFRPTIAFDDITLNSNSEESGDAFVAKYSPEGNAIWGRNFGGTGQEIASCETDASGNVYLGGMFFSKTVNAENFSLTNNGVMNAFVAKYDNNGKLIWTKSAGGNNGEAPATATREFYVDDNGNVYCTGSNWSEFTFAGKSIKPVAGSEDIFLLKYDKDGNELWGLDYGGSGRNAGRGITTDKNGNIFLTGSFDEKALKIDNYTLTNTGDSDIFIVKFSEAKK
ncbi:MAG: hypothetical protein IPP64_07970 [Bacteroidetes bacterium]|nr:hypothetical protein [Bacteroidota bacterium]